MPPMPVQQFANNRPNPIGADDMTMSPVAKPSPNPSDATTPATMPTSKPDEARTEGAASLLADVDGRSSPQPALTKARDFTMRDRPAAACHGLGLVTEETAAEEFSASSTARAEAANRFSANARVDPRGSAIAVEFRTRPFESLTLKLSQVNVQPRPHHMFSGSPSTVEFVPPPPLWKWAQLTRMNHLELAASSTQRREFLTLRRGLLLLSAEANALPSLAAGVSRSALNTLSSKIATNSAAFAREDAVAFARQNERYLRSTGTDVHAYVQRALREAYAVQTGGLFEQAMDTRRINDRRQKLRALAAKARAQSRVWADMLSADPDFVPEVPYDCIEVDDSGREVQPAMTSEDVAAWRAAAAARAGGDADALITQYKQLQGASTLDPEELELLMNLWVVDDNTIADSMEDLVAMLSKLTNRQLTTFLSKIFTHLDEGISNEDDLLALIDGLTPLQVAAMCSVEGFLREHRNKNSDVGRAIRKKLRLLATTLGHSPGAKFSGKEIDRMLEAVRQHTDGQQTREAALDAAMPAIGSPRRVESLSGLTTYIERLENEMNTAGEDAQLADVELQSMLQRQQQTLKMMTNISKMLHDTALAVVRKVP